MRGLSLGVFAVVSLSVCVGLAQAGPDSRARFARHMPRPQASSDSRADYIVRLREAPAATYMGGVPGYGPTSARARNEGVLDVSAAASYAAYLDERQSSLLEYAAQQMGRVLQARFRYHYALNGMSVGLTPAEARWLATLPGVVAVTPVRHFAPAVGMPASAGDTNASRAWVNAPIVWQLPTHSGTDNEGEGIVVADLDTGVNHANSSFAAIGPLDGYVAQDPGTPKPRFGVCDVNNASQHSLSTPVTCNDKLIGAYSYTHGSNDRESPEDSEGHGSHTASTIAGDFVAITVNGTVTPLSGVAPHASVIAYDICDPTDQCSSDQSVAAVDQAIQDQATLKAKWGSGFKGMVLNYSIGGTGSPYDDPVEMAFLSAVEAGIFVSAAGGNGGPANAVTGDPTSVYPVQHLGPWVATLAAATHDGTFSANLLENFAGGDARTRPGPSMAGAADTAALPLTTLVYAGSGAFSGKDPVQTGNAFISGEMYPPSQGSAADAQQCLFPFSAGTFTGGEIVVCDRGTIPLVDKAYNVMKGGAAGVVIVTTAVSSQDLPVEPYVIPGTLIGRSDGDALLTWIAASSTAMQADISGSTLTTDASEADQLAGFSSRGPNGSAFDSIVKPDLTAPGVSVLAAVSNPMYTEGCGGCSNQPETYSFFDGTSMAAPHAAGAAALLMQAHPSWTPSEIKSALMLTAVTDSNGTSPGLRDQCASLDSSQTCVAGAVVPSPQVRGDGRIDVDAAQRTGLILDETGVRYAAADPLRGGDLTSLNMASLGNAACSPTCSWTRIVKSAFAHATVNYSVSVTGLSSNLQVKVSPATFTLAPGKTQQLTISADAGGVPVHHWAFGELDITTGDTGDSGPVPAMHMPLAIQAIVPLPHMNVTSGTLDYTLKAGASGSQQFVIRNDGQKSLSWSLTANGGAGIANFPCSSSGMPGLSFDQRGGIVAAGSSTTVTATFDATGLSGNYSGLVCIVGDASDNPELDIPVAAKVTGSSSGGGGDMTLFGLAVLVLAYLRRWIS